MLLPQFVLAAIFAVSSVAALPGAPLDNAAVEARGVDGVDAGDLAARAEARRRRCPKHYHRHNGGCCKFRHIRRKYYDCHPW